MLQKLGRIPRSHEANDLVTISIFYVRQAQPAAGSTSDDECAWSEVREPEFYLAAPEARRCVRLSSLICMRSMDHDASQQGR